MLLVLGDLALSIASGVLKGIIFHIHGAEFVLSKSSKHKQKKECGWNMIWRGRKYTLSAYDGGWSSEKDAKVFQWTQLA